MPDDDAQFDAFFSELIDVCQKYLPGFQVQLMESEALDTFVIDVNKHEMLVTERKRLFHMEDEGN